jgi:two-component system, cell cycle sensor histidine kinase PleC
LMHGTSTGASTGGGDLRILRARLEIIVASLQISIFVNPIGAILTFLPMFVAPSIFGHLPFSRLVVAVGTHLVTSSIAFIVFIRNRTVIADPRRLQKQLYWLQLILSAGWGVTAWCLWTDGNALNNAFVSTAIVAILWSVTLARAADFRMLVIGNITLTAMYWLRLTTGHVETARLFALMMPMWLFFITIMGRAAHRQINAMLETRFRNEDLVHALAAARDNALAGRIEAESANASKTAFLATISHELRTPLNAILGFSDMIASEAMGPTVSPRYREYAGDIHESGAHLLALINDLLDIAKIEAEKMEIDPQPLDALNELEVVQRLTASKLLAREQTLTISLADNTPTLYADGRAVRRILLNLLSNAMKFSPEGGHIMLSGRAAKEGGFLLVVEDNGLGIPADKLDRIFAPFNQVDNRFDRQAGGSGLGLALVKGLIELHGGRVWLESMFGKGTKVFVYFPLAKSHTGALQEKREVQG